MGKNLYFTLTGAPEGEPSAPISYWFYFGVTFAVMAGTSVSSLWILVFPGIIDGFIARSDPSSCSKCGYNLTGTKNDKQIYCPECGEEITYEDI
jgi:hypothetical protein